MFSSGPTRFSSKVDCCYLKGHINIGLDCLPEEPLTMEKQRGVALVFQAVKLQTKKFGSVFLSVQGKLIKAFHCTTIVVC